MRVVRPASEADLPSLLTLYRQLNHEGPHITPDDAAGVWRRMQASPGLTIFVAESDGIVVATCVLAITPNLTRGGASFALIENVVTHDAHRRQGHGRAVLDAAVAAAWAAGCYKVMLTTGSPNPATLRFYEQAGFSRGRVAFQKRRAIP